MGLTMSFFLVYYGEALEKLWWLLRTTEKYVRIELVRELVLWIMGWPAGFKLNDNLDDFMGNFFLFYLDRWNEALSILDSFPVSVTHCLSVAGFFGLSAQIALVLDFFSFFMLYLASFRALTTTMISFQSNAISSLWNLFRGRKHNPLKKRIDTCEFDLEQLLLGTVLFAVLIFLFPTVAFYYVCFTMAYSLVIILKAMGLALIQLMRVFPIYSIYVYLRKPSSLPGGVQFLILDISEQQQQQGKQQRLSSSSSFNAYLILKSSVIPFTALFSRFNVVLEKAVKRNCPSWVYKRFLEVKRA